VSKKAFLDTNIVADVIDIKRKHHKESLEILEQLILKDYTICISEDMISTLYYISKGKEATLQFFQNVVFVDWEILSFGRDTLQQGIEISLREGGDLEDILQCLCAKNNGCTLLVTNDKRFFNCDIDIQTSKNGD